MFTRLILPILAAVVLGFSVISILRTQPAGFRRAAGASAEFPV